MPDTSHLLSMSYDMHGHKAIAAPLLALAPALSALYPAVRLSRVNDSCLVECVRVKSDAHMLDTLVVLWTICRPFGVRKYHAASPHIR